MADLIGAHREVEILGSLPEGWDYGSGRPASVSTRAKARTILTTLYGLGLRVFDVAPGKNGGITLGAVKAGDEIEIQCRETDRYGLYVTYNKNHIIDEDNLTYSALIQALGGIPWLSMKSFTWFTQGITCLTWEDSQVKHLRILPMDPGYQSFARSAPQQWGEASAAILVNMPDQAYAANRQFFGDSSSRPLEAV